MQMETENCSCRAVHELSQDGMTAGSATLIGVQARMAVNGALEQANPLLFLVEDVALLPATHTGYMVDALSPLHERT